MNWLVSLYIRVNTEFIPINECNRTIVQDNDTLYQITIGWNVSETIEGFLTNVLRLCLSFMGTSISGAMAERTKLTSYMLFSFINTVLFSIPAHWVWASKGWLYKMGVVDIAGAGPVHLVGGVTGLVATLLLKPRHGRYDGGSSRTPQMSSPTNAVLGMFMLW